MISWETPDPLFSLTHLDGRNSHKLASLRPYFSEFAWVKMRLSVMADYLIAIFEFLKGKKLPSPSVHTIIALVNSFSLADAKAITALEAKTNHDLKAIEQYFVLHLQKNKFKTLLPYVNLGIGSEDINSIALGRLLGECATSVLLPYFQKIASVLMTVSHTEKNTMMVARTHAQAANITTFGKEVANSLLRLCDEVEIFTLCKFSAKCTGEVGSLQGFIAVDSDSDWLTFSDKFIRSYGLIPTHAATQITPYDHLVRLLQSLERINLVLLDFVKNMWIYVLIGYVRVTKVETEVGSAGMPHKVNPIYFEGAEGGFLVANGLLETLCRTLPLNRLQRDFSDSTTRRSISMPIGLSVLSYQSIVEGMKRLSVDREAIASDLAMHYEVYLESVKVFGLQHGVTDIFDLLKAKTRGRRLDKVQFYQFIDGLSLNRKVKKDMHAMIQKVNPYPAKIVNEAIERAKEVFQL